MRINMGATVNEDVWDFAYGSNLSRVRMEKRTGRIRQAVRCYLPDHRLAFNKKAQEDGEVYASIIPSDGDRVWGAVYLCDPDAMGKLDRCEGVRDGHYYRMPVEVIGDDGAIFGAIAYVAGKDFVIAESRPSDEYLKHILDGAEEHALPEEYIEQIKSLAGR
jgi:gamma-glutamylcyclotransferase (GGCT)/AIG2-like uncharacterized protein YtfP